MKPFVSRWNLGVFVSCVVLSLAQVACGDDEGDTEPTAGKGGSSAGKGGSSAGKGGSSAGKGGTSGSSAGKGGASGAAGGASVAECKTKTDAIAATLPSGCSMCACTENPSALSSCDGACWSLIACADAKCGDVPSAMAQSCALSMCATEISAAIASGSVGVVSVVGGILQGATCGTICTASDQDGGV